MDLLAALARRFAHLLVAPWELRMQVYVDDPILTAAGSHEQSRWLFTVVLLFWAALGFKLSWKRRPERLKSRTDWWRIGVLQEGFATQLTEAEAQAAKDSVDEFLHDQPAGLISGLPVVDCVSCASARQTLCLDARGKQVRFGKRSLRAPDSHVG